MRKLWMLSGCLCLLLVQPLVAAAVPAPVTLNENCVVNVLNRTIQVEPDGQWVLPNIPSTMGQIRARATCTVNGVTYSGQSNYFTIVRNGVSDAGQIVFGAIEPVPQSLTFSSPSIVLTTLGQVSALSVTAAYADGTSADVTPSTSGINYASSNPAIATISPQGVVTAIANGNVIITARKDGAVAIASVRVAVAGGDTDGDGIPDDVEIALGLNPNDLVDALEDQDGDGLTAIEEYNLGTDIFNADTDGDGIPDGVEVSGSNGYVTNPLIADTDGDGIPDGLEIATGSDPTDNASGNLGAVLSSIEVSPTSAILEYNVIDAEVTKQLTVTGNLIDGSTIDLTSKSTGTNYVSSDLTVANFGPVDGLVYAGQNGATLVTVTNNGFEAQMSVIVKTFTPVALSALAIPGYANNIDVSGNFAYIAAGSAGMQVVDVSNPRSPYIAASLDTYGTAIDIRIDGNYAYIADGTSGLVIMDVSNPLVPLWVSSVDTLGTAQDVVVNNGYAYIANGNKGLAVIDVSNPAIPFIVGTLSGMGSAVGVDVSGTTVVLGANTSVYTIDVSNPALPVRSGSIVVGSIKDLVVRDNLVYTAAFMSGFHIIDITIPATPVIVGQDPSYPNYSFASRDIELNRDKAYFAEQLFPNAIPYVNVANPSTPVFQGIINLAPLGDYAGTGIAVTDQFVYVTEESFIVRGDFLASGNTRLFIAQHHTTTRDTGTIPPEVTLTSPIGGETFMAGQMINLQATAVDDVAVAAVNFYVNGQLVGSDASGPYSFNTRIPIDATGVTLSVEAVDYAGNVGYGTDVIVNNIQPYPGPSISILTAPAAGTVITGGQTVSFSVEASDPVASIDKVDLLVGGTVVSTVLAAPYNFSYTLPLTATGSLSFEMVATSSTGATVSTGVQTYTVTPYAGLALSYNVVTSLDPAGNGTLQPGDTVYKGITGMTGFTVIARASDAIGWITKVELLVGGVPVTPNRYNPGWIAPGQYGDFYFSYTPPADYPVEGPVELEVRATASTGITKSLFWTFNFATYYGPSVSIVEPVPGDTLVQGDTVRLKLDVSDSIVYPWEPYPKVDVKIDGVSIGTIAPMRWEIPLYEMDVVLPNGKPTVDLEVVAANGFYGVIPTSTILQTYDLIPDPLTIVTGKVVDAYAAPIVGADVKVLLPDQAVETGSVSLSSGALLFDPNTSKNESVIAGSMTFDPAVTTWFGRSVNFDSAELVSVNGSIVLDHSASGYNPLAPVETPGVIDLYVTAPSGLNMVLQAPFNNFIPSVGQHAISMLFDVVSVTPGTNTALRPLLNQDMMVQVDGTVDITVDPVTQQVTAMAWNLTSSHLVYGYRTTSAIDGSFVVWNVPTIHGDLEVAASSEDFVGKISKGNTVAPYVRGGITDIGNVVLTPDSVTNFEADYGTDLKMVSDGCVSQPLGFAFPYYGVKYAEVFVNAVGSLSFGACDPGNRWSWNWYSAVPRILPMDSFATIPSGGGVYAKKYIDRVTFTWDLPGIYWNALLDTATYQATLFADGRIQFGYKDLAAISGLLANYGGEGVAIVGLSPAGYPPVTYPDYTLDTPLSTSMGEAVIEEFWSPLDLGMNSFLIFTPNAWGGYDVDYTVP